MNQGGRRSNLFTLELVLNLFLFALCAAVCVALLIHARSMSRQSQELTQAVYLAQSAAEQWRATGTVPIWDGPDGDGFTGRFDAAGNTLDISIYQGNRLIYTLEGVVSP